ncbi:MAG: cation diffusion facilitator family transporter [Nitrososphaerales archaeon]
METQVNRKQSAKGRLEIALGLSFVVLILEIVGGLEFSSSALIAEALHLFTDIFAISFSLIALIISVRPPTSTLTYGYHRLEVFASFTNGISLFIITGVIAYSAYLKFLFPSHLNALGTASIAVLALVINLISNHILNSESDKVPSITGEDLNLKSASTHVFGDALASLAVIIGALAVHLSGDYIFDPIVAAFIGLIVLRSAIKVTWAGLSIMLEGSPVKNMPALESDLKQVSGVSDVHDLHIWRICSHITVATLHACLNDEGREKRLETMTALEGKLSKSYGVQHATIQLEDICCIPKHGH